MNGTRRDFLRRAGPMCPALPGPAYRQGRLKGNSVKSLRRGASRSARRPGNAYHPARMNGNRYRHPFVGADDSVRPNPLPSNASPGNTVRGNDNHRRARRPRRAETRSTPTENACICATIFAHRRRARWSRPTQNHGAWVVIEKRGGQRRPPLRAIWQFLPVTPRNTRRSPCRPACNTPCPPPRPAASGGTRRGSTASPCRRGTGRRKD